MKRRVKPKAATAPKPNRDRARIGRMVVPTAYDKVDAWEAVLRARDEVTQ